MRAFPDFVLLAHVLSRTSSGLDHELEYSFIPIKAMIMHLEANFSSALRFEQLLDLNRKLRRLLDDKIHCALSLFVSHRKCRFPLSRQDYLSTIPALSSGIDQSIEPLISVSDRCFSTSLSLCQSR